MARDDNTPSINLPEGQRIRWEGRLLTYRGRARARARSHIFLDDAGVPVSMTDQLLIAEQQAERLRLVTQEELDRADKSLPRHSLDMAAPEDLREAEMRQRYMHAWVNAGRPSRTLGGLGPVIRRTAADASDPKPPSWRTMTRWIADWMLCGERPDGLLPGKGGNRTDRIGAGRDLLRDTVERYYLVDTKPSATVVHRHVQAAFEDHNKALPPDLHLPTPSFQATLDQIRTISLYEVDHCRSGPRLALHRHRPVTSGPVSHQINDAWETDHTVVDAVVIDEETTLPIGRSCITVMLDRCSRAPMGLRMSFEPPSANAALDCLRVSVSPKEDLLASIPGMTASWPCFGTPRVLITDQGKEFRSKAFLESCLALGIDVQHTPVLKAWYKARIERFFGTLTRSVFHRVPGTTFSNFFERNNEAIPERVAVTTLRELRELTIRFFVEIYMRRPHRALGGRSPLEIWNEQAARHGIRMPPSPAEVTSATALTVWRRPQRYGIEYETLIYNSADIANFRVNQNRPQLVRIRVDPSDLTKVTFIDPIDGMGKVVPIQPALRSLVAGVSLEKHKLARALQRQNPERLEGLEGLRKAYRIMDAAMAARSGQDGLRNRTKAARYWETLTRPAPPEDPPAFDIARSGRSILGESIEAILADVPGDVVSPVVGGVAADKAEDDALAEADARPRRQRRPRQPRRLPDAVAALAPEAGDVDGVPADDLDLLLQGLNLSMTRPTDTEKS